MGKNKKLLELFRQSDEPNFMKFLDGLEIDGVVDAKKIFEEKKRQDKKMTETLARVNKINNLGDKGE